MIDQELIFTAMRVFLGLCAVVVAGLAGWLAWAIVGQETAAVGRHEVDDAHRLD